MVSPWFSHDFFHGVSLFFHGFFKELGFKELEIHRYSLLDTINEYQGISINEYQWISINEYGPFLWALLWPPLGRLWARAAMGLGSSAGKNKTGGGAGGVQYIAGPKVFCFSIKGLSVVWEPFPKVFHGQNTKLHVLAAGTVRIFKRS